MCWSQARAPGPPGSLPMSSPTQDLTDALARSLRGASPCRAVASSLSNLVLPLADEPQLYQIYVNMLGQCRIGMLMEDMDAFAGLVAYRHVDGVATSAQDVPVLVTASCDRIAMHTERVDARQNLQMVGAVTHVGRSSLNIDIDVATVAPSPERVLSASFTFVARHRGEDRAYEVPRLVCHTAAQQAMYDAGAAKQRVRRKAREQSLLRTPPAAKELAVIHALYVKAHDQRQRGDGDHKAYAERASREGEGATASIRVLAPSATTRHATELCHPLVKNAHGKVFGGFLMRKAFELAWMNAYINMRRQPRFIAVDDIFFKAGARATPLRSGSRWEGGGWAPFRRNS